MPPFEFPQLLYWYKNHGRHHLPWRDYHFDTETLCYRIWLSEILLQQTQAARVVGYFDKILDRFPTLQSLAQTDYDTFFPYYQGLGYYSRAKNILACAQTLIKEHA
jgi:A/G-specific adenine glycosylase